MRKFIVFVFLFASSGAFANGLVNQPYPRGQVPGTNTNDAGGTGVVGQYVVSEVGNTAVALVNSTAVNLTSVSLTAGDWDCTGTAVISPTATLTQVWAYQNTTSATLGASSITNGSTLLSVAFTAAGLQYIPTGTVRYTLTGTTTIYLQTLAFFTSTATGGGGIRCRRVR